MLYITHINRFTTHENRCGLGAAAATANLRRKKNQSKDKHKMGKIRSGGDGGAAEAATADDSPNKKQERGLKSQ
jgi:hypothetical protein